jgi:hypothetical protein
MPAIVPHDNKPALILRWAGLATGAACALLAARSASFADDRPTVRAGLWKFERMLETDGKPTDRVLSSGLPYARQVTRCVNPTIAIQAETAPSRSGLCKISDLRRKEDDYDFQKVCGDGAPVKTTINITSDSAYTEINEGRIGGTATKEIIEAQRVSDCHPPSASLR